MVTKNILIQYSDLLREIEYISKKIDELRNERVKHEAKRKHDIVKASSKNFPYIEHNIHIEGLDDTKEMLLNKKISDEIEKLEKRYETLVQVTREVMDYIESVDDSRMRMIITYRVIENYSWNKVADMMGGGNTEDSVKKMFYRFMEK